MNHPLSNFTETLPVLYPAVTLALYANGDRSRDRDIGARYLFRKESVMRRFIILVALFVVLVAGLAVVSGASTFAANPPGQGQPNQSCGSETAPNTPGNAANAPGSAFNPNGQAGSVYAGQQPQNSNNPKSVSQYDVSCFQQPSH
jgi:hypothetical protein